MKSIVETGQVIVLGREVDRGAAAEGRAFRFVGRGRELEALLSAVRCPPAVVLVEGEAGIGKSRLVREAVAELPVDRQQVLTGYCHPLREPFPYGPVVDALRGADLARARALPPTAGALAPLLPDLAHRLPPQPPRPPDTAGQRFQLLQAVRSFLAALGPTTLVVEDLHWVDDATRDLLLLLARDLPPELGLVLTYRAEDLPPRCAVLGTAYRHPPGTSGTVVQLGPLLEPDVRELAAAVLGPHAAAGLGAALYERSQGLPLVLEEDLITLAEQTASTPGRTDAAERLHDADVPHGLREAVTERLGRLSPAAGAIAAAAAVLAVPASEELLAALAGLEPDQGAEALIELLRASVLREGEGARYVFRHVLAQQVAYRRVPAPTRLRLHRRAVALLEARTPPPLVQIAHHTLASGDLPAWLGRAQDAADRAIAVRDAGTAATLLHQLLERPELTGTPRSRAALELARIAAYGVDFTANAQLLRRLLDDPQLPVEIRGEIRLGLGLGLLNQSADPAGFDEVERAADELAALRPERAVRAMVALALKEAEGPDYTRAWLARAETAVADSPNEVLGAAVHATRLTLMSCQGDGDVWELTDRLPRSSDDPELLRQTARALHNVADTGVDLGHDRRALASATEAREIAARVGSPIVMCLARATLLRLDALAGRWDGLERRFDDLLAEYPGAAGPKADRAVLAGFLASARGERTRALELYAEAAEITATQLVVGIDLRVAAGLASLHLAHGDARQARAVAERAVAVVRRAAAWPRSAGLVSVAVEAELACDRRSAAQRLSSEFERGILGRDTPAAHADLEVARGLLLQNEEPAAAAAHFAAAARGWQKIGRPYETARALERQGRSLRTDPGAADAPLRAALAAFADLGATADAARCKRLVRELSPNRGGPGRRGYGGELSPREHEVAALLAAGATNQRIAESLVLSPRTVENHVAKVLRKLGAGRKQVAAVYPAKAHGIFTK